MAFAQQIITQFKPFDVVQLRGVDENVKIKTSSGEISMNTKGWNPITWAIYT